MFKLLSIKQSSKIGKKYDATFYDKNSNKYKMFSFGAKNYRDYTLINNKNSKFYIKDKEKREKVKENYQKRHAKDLLTDESISGLSRGALSYYILWTATTLNKGIENYKKKYNL